MPAVDAGMSLSADIAWHKRLVSSGRSALGSSCSHVIPVVGFLANGIAFTTGQAEVEDAFGSVKHASTLAETSQDLKGALASMRILVRDFAIQPDAKLMRKL